MRFGRRGCEPAAEARWRMPIPSRAAARGRVRPPETARTLRTSHRAAAPALPLPRLARVRLAPPEAPGRRLPALVAAVVQMAGSAALPVRPWIVAVLPRPLAPSA